METPSGSLPRVLVVDDEMGFRELCQDLLSDSGYEVAAVENGALALERLSQESFQVVLTDINMPVLDGLGFLKAAKPKHPDVEVILMTAFGGLQTALEALRLGAYDYITKPFTREGLLATVGRCLEKHRLSSELRRVQGELLEKERLAALGSVSGWLAHRMRNPLNVILMCAQYLGARFTAGDERREVAQAIEEKCKILERMTHDFIGFSRNYEPRYRTENLRDILEQALGTLTSRIALQKIQVDKNFSEVPPFPLDRELLEEVFGYLLDNALEAINEMGTLRLRMDRERDGVFVTVSNTGASIPSEVRPRLFEPFFTTKERGTGLGLAIAKRVIESQDRKSVV